MPAEVQSVSSAATCSGSHSIHVQEVLLAMQEYKETCKNIQDSNGIVTADCDNVQGSCVHSTTKDSCDTKFSKAMGLLACRECGCLHHTAIEHLSVSGKDLLSKKGILDQAQIDDA